MPWIILFTHVQKVRELSSFFRVHLAALIVKNAKEKVWKISTVSELGCLSISDLSKLF